MPKVIWSGLVPHGLGEQRVRAALFEGGSYRYGPSLPWPQERRPANLGEVIDARRAAQLGVIPEGEVPAERWEPEPGVPVSGTAEEILAVLRRALESAEWTEGVVDGPVPTEWISDHPADCWCGGCPGTQYYGDAQHHRDGWATTLIPEEWYVRDGTGYPTRLRYRVQTADLRHLIAGSLYGGMSGTLLGVREGIAWGLPDEALDLLVRLEDEAEKKRAAYWAAREEEERAALRARFKK